MIDVKIVNKSDNLLPAYATIASAGMDLSAYFEDKKPRVLKPLERMLISTGLYIQLPVGFEAQVRPRSGLALRRGITVLNSPGTIDADYIGEVGVILINLSNEDFVINSGDRVAQLVIAKHEQCKWDVKLSVEEDFEKTDRGDKGYGHTGIEQSKI